VSDDPTTTAAKVTEFAEMVVEMLDEHEVAIGCEHTVAEVARAITVEADDFFGRANRA
jgi:hypothetical protein